MSIIGTFPATIANGQVEDATVVMSLFSWIQAQTNGNACPATVGTLMLKGDGFGGTIGATDGTDFLSPTTAATSAVYTPAGTGSVPTTVQAKLRESVSVLDFMTAAQVTQVLTRTGSLDLSSALQTAIDYLATKSGGEIFFPAGTYLFKTAINLTSDNSTSRAYIHLIGTGQGTVFNAQTGSRLFDCIGSNFLTFRDFYVVSVGATPSIIGWQIARGLQVNYCHFLRIEDVTCELQSIHTANNGFGTIGVFNAEGEDNSYINGYFATNTPLMLTRIGAFHGVTITSYVAVSVTSVSFGMLSFGGKTTLQAWNYWCPALFMDGVNSLSMPNVHMTSSLSPWDSDTTGTNVWAIETGSSSPCFTIQHTGLIETFVRYMAMGNTVQAMNVNVFVAANGATTNDYMIGLVNHTLIDCDIKLINGDAGTARRNIVLGTGIVKNCNLNLYGGIRGFPAALVPGVINTNYTTDQVDIYYGYNTAKNSLNIGTPINVAGGVIFYYLPLPAVVSGNNAGFVSVKVDGILTTYGVDTQSDAPCVARVTAYIDLVSTKTGTYTIGTPVTTLSTPIAGNAGQALITLFTVSAAIVGNVLQLTGTAQGTGTGVYTNGIQLSGDVSVSWNGFSAQGPAIN